MALDQVPDADDVGVGSIIFFAQGSYRASEGNNTGGVRYHEGIITKVTTTDDNILIDGHHTRGEADRKYCSYKGYAYEFHGVSLNNIRLAASALDTLQ